jgi:hypothetical protein
VAVLMLTGTSHLAATASLPSDPVVVVAKVSALVVPALVLLRFRLLGFLTTWAAAGAMTLALYYDLTVLRAG